ncbi:FliM/FliN family flagellar motor switch protein [Phenylobacterium sp.]|uniref:FliM/FliN family flagellar motor switch protein n=1 Tax=Phenylobacterium sp. TaxID=1871053 RepID=UPI0025F1109D|nr:FliM/FliN family flagellar motor switch protein [Phenylobacterium sp.]
MSRPMWVRACVAQSPAVQSRSSFVSQVKAVNVEIQVVLGRAQLPMAQLLRMGRGAVIPLDTTVNEEVWILANNHPVARGEIQINDERIAITVTREANVYDYMAGSA